MKINIRIKPNSKKGPLVEKQADGSLIVYVREIAVDGKANQAVVKLLSKYLNTPKTSITILKGHTSRHKLIEIKGI